MHSVESRADLLFAINTAIIIISIIIFIVCFWVAANFVRVLFSVDLSLCAAANVAVFLDWWNRADPQTHYCCDSWHSLSNCLLLYLLLCIIGVFLCQQGSPRCLVDCLCVCVLCWDMYVFVFVFVFLVLTFNISFHTYIIIFTML